MTPRGVLVCSPAYFDVVDQKNPFMRPDVPVSAALARQQWQGVVDAFAASGLEIHRLAPLEGCEDMVFTANPAFTGIDMHGARRSIASRMRFGSRQLEVGPQIDLLTSLGYAPERQLAQGIGFEGGGDAVWDFERNVIYLGIGPRTDAGIVSVLEAVYGVEVFPVHLTTDRFYHLDTALAVLDGDTCILYPGAFDAASYSLLARRFPKAIEVDEAEANRMACNAAKAGGRAVIIDSGAVATAAQLRKRGYDVATVETSEFMKSGGSVYCMKQYVF